MEVYFATRNKIELEVLELQHDDPKVIAYMSVKEAYTC